MVGNMKKCIESIKWWILINLKGNNYEIIIFWNGSLVNWEKIIKKLLSWWSIDNK